MKIPGAMLAVRYSNAVVNRDDMIVYGEDGLCVDAQPGHLKAIRRYFIPGP